ncbi:DM13 domain-containing protein [Roseovarius faecimaris]|uniref:DM13 domain-containing protein n=1 Tax=Roseovarius faecimaris TaxID=2494550 RepID=UPI001FE3234D|nr:DM13 domain-containing protein [Roseovarius faecimaris]
MKRLALRVVTHLIALVAGFAIGVYTLPILTAPPSPDQAMLDQSAKAAVFTAEFATGLPGNDALHWGEGTVSLTATQIVHTGRLAPGPDYRLYLVPEFVDDEDAFTPLMSASRMVGKVETFHGFIVDLPPDVDLDRYTTVLIWCEAFGEFIAAAEYR